MRKLPKISANSGRSSRSGALTRYKRRKLNQNLPHAIMYIHNRSSFCFSVNHLYLYFVRLDINCFAKLMDFYHINQNEEWCARLFVWPFVVCACLVITENRTNTDVNTSKLFYASFSADTSLSLSPFTKPTDGIARCRDIH